jgi:uncharacterized membrane protein YjgN (DUF898 family)
LAWTATSVEKVALSGTALSGGAERIVRPEFTASAREYFRIWIVNLLFTLATLGIYSAWAKVRKTRYFYGSTRLDGASFDYFGSPKAILKGRLIAVTFFIVYVLASELYPPSRFAFWVIAIVLLPWLVLRALAFNARNSAHRGLRFEFDAKPVESAGVYIGMGLLTLVTAGIAFPWFVARLKSFIVSHHSFGTTRFECSIPGKTLFGIYFRAGLLMSLVAIPSALLTTFVIPRLPLPEGLSWIALVLSALPLYLAYAVGFAYSQAHSGNLMWASARTSQVRFSSSLSFKKLAGLYLGNIVGIACTAGLLIPWAAVRTLRYRLESFVMVVDGDAVHQANPRLPGVGATGQELADVFDVDLAI